MFGPVFVACAFEGNHAALGGGLANINGDPTLEGCSFSGNTADLEGGGMHASGGRFPGPSLLGVSFVGNHATARGGAAVWINSRAMAAGCTFSGNTAAGSGGAIFLDDDTAISDCTFLGNVASWGGALHGAHGANDPVTGCLFQGNHALVIGGAVYVNSALDFTECQFDSNTCDDRGGAIFGGQADLTATGCTFTSNSAQRGGAIGFSNETLTLIGCTLSGNSAAEGGGLWIRAERARIRDTIIESNSADIGGGLYTLAESGADEFLLLNCALRDNSATGSGGGLAHVQTSPATVLDVVQTLFSGNQGACGGALSAEGGLVHVVNCAMTLNAATAFGGAVCADGTDDLDVRNSILWANDAPQGPQLALVAVGTVAEVLHCDVEGGLAEVYQEGTAAELDWGPGNLDADPMFVDPGSNDLHLQPGSPALDAGHNWAVMPDVIDLDDDSDFAEFTPTDADGRPRFSSDGSPSGAGCGAPVIVDMGAYEFQVDPVETVVFADADGDGLVGVSDLVELILDWGECTGCCLGDLDLNGVVDVADLITLIENWS